MLITGFHSPQATPYAVALPQRAGSDALRLRCEDTPDLPLTNRKPNDHASYLPSPFVIVVSWAHCLQSGDSKVMNSGGKHTLWLFGVFFCGGFFQAFFVPVENDIDSE